MGTFTGKLQVTTTSLEQTIALGKAIGTGIEAGLVITLDGDLASGKTAFVQGLAAGLEVPGEYYVTSPSYTLINEYPGRLPLCHVDLYRLGAPCDIEDIGLVEMLDGNCVLAVEWPANLDREELADHLAIHIQIHARDTRCFKMTAYGLPAANLLKGITNLKIPVLQDRTPGDP